MLLADLTIQILNKSRTSLGSPFKYVTPLMIKKFFLIYKWDF